MNAALFISCVDADMFKLIKSLVSPSNVTDKSCLAMLT